MIIDFNLMGLINLDIDFRVGKQIFKIFMYSIKKVL